MVRAMVSRVYLAGFIVILSLGTMLVSSESFGRSGGSGGRSSSGFHGSTSSGHHRSAMRSSLNRRSASWGFPLYGTGYYSPGTYSEPAEITNNNSSNLNSSVHVHAAPEPVSSSYPVSVYPVVFYHPGCNSQTVTVPWEDGQQRSVNIVRC
jgi:hypothetical protein